MSQAVRKRETRKDEVIQVRASAELKALLNRAAELRGQKLSEFVLESSRRSAEDALLDQRAFFLSPKDYDKFLALLDAPPKVTKEMRARFDKKRIW